MSLGSRSWQPSDDLPDRLGGPSTLSMPDDWTLSTPWQRAQEERDEGGPINDAERMVYLTGSDEPHRVTFALRGRTLVTECDCAAWTFHDWCSHVAACWWRWSRDRILVSHLDTGRDYPAPPSWLSLDDDAGRTAYDRLTPAELDAYLTCGLGDVGVREYARETDRRPGTVGNLLARAREKTGGDRR
jgi:hypothetical protein